MAKDTQKIKTTKTTDDLLLELTNKKQEDLKEDTETKEMVLTKPSSTVEELKDLTSANATNSKPLTETDYLILEQHCLGTSEEVIAEQYKVSKGYINSLLRNSNSSSFLDKYTKTLQQKVIAKGMGGIAEALDRKNKYLAKLFAEDKDELAFREYFGKLSMVEVQEKLAKMYSDEEDDSTAPIQNLFLNLQQR